MPGRPSKLTPAREKAILEAVRKGNYFTTACRAAGISENTGNKWLDRGRIELERIEAGVTDETRAESDYPPAAQEARYAQFAQAVDLTRAEAEQRVVSFIHLTIEGGYVKETRTDKETGEVVVVYAAPDGRLGLEWLARVHARRYGRRQTVELTGESGGPVQVEASDGARLAERLRDFLANVKNDPRIIEARVTARSDTLIGTAPAAIEQGDRSDDDAR